MIRFFYLISCFMHYRLYNWLTWPYRILFYPLFFIAPWSLWPAFQLSKEESLRIALEKMGPIFIKFGQLLSTRKDLIDSKLAVELSKLQDNVPAFPGKVVLQICQRSLGEKFKRFDSIDLVPLASGSIAQVHKALLDKTTVVALKIRRPHLIKMIQKDVFLMKIFAYAITYLFGCYRLRLVSVVKEFEEALTAETDFIREASHASQLQRNFQNDSDIYIPKIHWDLCTEEILITEHIQAPNIKELMMTPLPLEDKKIIAEQIFLTFLKQVFEHGFFHADMHPGNIFIKRVDQRKFQLQLVDFGIIGVLSPSDLRYLAENLLAFFEQDYHRVAVLHLQSGWVPPTLSIQQFEFSIRRVCEPIFQRPLNQISVAETFMKLIQVAQQHKVIVQPQLILLQKTILAVEGLSRELYPQLDLWERIYPYIRDRVWAQYSTFNEVKGLVRKIPFLLEKLNVEMPSKQSINQAEQIFSGLSITRALFALSLLFNTTLFLLDQYPSWKEYFAIVFLHVIVYRSLVFVYRSALYA